MVIGRFEAFFHSLPLPLLEQWGRIAYAVGFALMLAAFGRFTFRPAGVWGGNRRGERYLLANGRYPPASNAKRGRV